MCQNLALDGYDIRLTGAYHIVVVKGDHLLPPGNITILQHTTLGEIT